MYRLFVLLYCLSSCTPATTQSRIPPIPGWDQQTANGITKFTPRSHSPTGVIYEIFSPRKITKEEENNLADWLQRAAMKNLLSSGYSTSSIVDSESVEENGYYYFNIAVKSSAEKTLVISFISYRRQDGQTRLAKYTQPADLKTPHVDTALNHFMSLSKAESKMNKDEKQASTAAATQAVDAAGLEGIVIHEEYTYGVGGILILEYRPYLLLKDGSIFKHPKTSPYDVNAKTSKQNEPDKWGTWKLLGKTLVVQLPERGGLKTYEWKEKQWYWTKPAVKGEVINGSFLTMSGGGNTASGGSTMIAVSSNIRFNNKGQFTHATSAGATSGGGGAYSETDKAGTYKLNGYSIELHYNNGQIVKTLFYFFPDGKDNFGMGGRTYTKN